VGCTLFEDEKASFSLELIDYYWESKDVFHIGEPNIWDVGVKEKDILIVELQVTNETNWKGQVSFTPWYLIDEDGNRFDAIVSGDIQFEEDISMMTINPGETVRGKVVFKIPSENFPVWVHCNKCTTSIEIR